MPILDTSAWGTPSADPSAPAPVKQAVKTGFVDGLAATWQRESIWTPSIVRPALEYPDDHQFDYQTYDKNLWPLVSVARNKEHADDLVKQFAKEQEAKAIMDNQSFITGLGTNVLVGMTNPLNYIGVGKAATLGYAALKGAAGAVIGTALTEPILHANQVSRTGLDSAENIAGAAVGGAVLGAGGKAIANKLGNVVMDKAIARQIAVNELVTNGPFGADSIGAARASVRTMADAQLASIPFIPQSWTEPIARFAMPFSRSANQRLMTSEFTAVRNAQNILLRSGLATKQNVEGVANQVPIEVAVGQRGGDLYTQLITADTEFRKAWWSKVEAGTYDKDSILAALRAQDPSLPENYKLNRTSFDKVVKLFMADNTSIGREMDEVFSRVKKAAEIRNTLDAEKIDFGLVSDKTQLVDIVTGKRVEDPLAMVSSNTHKFAYEDGAHYLSRVFDKGRITGDREGFKKALIDGWTARNAASPVDADDLDRFAEGVISKLLNEENTVSLGELRQNLDLPGGYTKGRTLNLDDRYLVNWTHDDVLSTEMYHVSQALVDVELAKQGVKFDELLNEVTREFNAKVEAIKAEHGEHSTKAADEISALGRTRTADIEELQYAMRRLKRKGPGNEGTLMRSLNEWTSRANIIAGASQLGSSALPNSLGDVASVARNFGTGRSLKIIAKQFSKEFRDDIKANAEQMGVLSDLVDRTVREAQLSEKMADSMNPNKGFKGSKMQGIDSALDRGQDIFAKVSLIDGWSRVGRTVASAASTQHILDAAAKGWDGLSPTVRTDLAKFYIDKTMLERIAAEASKHADDVGGLKFAGIDKWTDEEAIRVFRASVYAHTEHALNIPSIGSGSKFMTENFIGRTWNRFKTFNNASHESTFLSSLQNREYSRVVTGTLNYTFWGFASLYAYDTVTGRDTSMDKYFGDVDKATLTGWKILNKSGYVAAAGDAFATMVKLGGHKNSPFHDEVRKVFPESLERELFPKYENTSLLGKIAGPTFSYAERAVETATALLDGDIKDKDIGKVRDMLPGQNIGWLRRGLDYVEEALGGRAADRNASK